MSRGFDADGEWTIAFGKHEGFNFYACVQGARWLSVDGVADAVHVVAGDVSSSRGDARLNWSEFEGPSSCDKENRPGSRGAPRAADAAWSLHPAPACSGPAPSTAGARSWCRASSTAPKRRVLLAKSDRGARCRLENLPAPGYLAEVCRSATYSRSPAPKPQCRNVCRAELTGNVKVCSSTERWTLAIRCLKGVFLDAPRVLREHRSSV